MCSFKNKVKFLRIKFKLLEKNLTALKIYISYLQLFIIDLNLSPITTQNPLIPNQSRSAKKGNRFTMIALVVLPPISRMSKITFSRSPVLVIWTLC